MACCGTTVLSQYATHFAQHHFGLISSQTIKADARTKVTLEYFGDLF
jgi:hypothetical protein